MSNPTTMRLATLLQAAFFVGKAFPSSSPHMLSAIDADATECRSSVLLQRGQHRIRDVAPMMHGDDVARHGGHIGQHSATHAHGFSHLQLQSTETQSWQIYLVAVALWLGILVVLISWRSSSDYVARCVANAFQRFSRVHTNVGHESTLRAYDGQGAIQNERISQPHVCYPALPPGATLLEQLLISQELPAEKHIAIGAAGVGENVRSWTYKHLTDVMKDPSWNVFEKGTCIGMALLPGPEFAVALICSLARFRCAPMNPDCSTGEATAMLTRLGVAGVLISADACKDVEAAAVKLALPVWSIPQQSAGVGCGFAPSLIHGSPSTPEKPLPTAHAWNMTDDVALLLRTSGTTGNSKVVPLRLGQLVSGARCIAASMGLRQHDVCLNAMPLFHIGGISCNLLGSLVSGGTVLCLGRFDPHQFVHCLSSSCIQDSQPTWYYAVPSMHLALAEFCQDVAPEHRLRLVRSGAAALTPVLQERMRRMWNCQVLATYSMTECMPVASPVIGATQDSTTFGEWPAPLGSVGLAIGPTVAICKGEVMIRGDLVMHGYEGAENGLTADGFLPTGDLGHLDSEGYLWLVGRSKEIINRGGETIPPREIEDKLEPLHFIKDAAAFPMPHQRLGETVGLAVVIRDEVIQNKGDAELLACAQKIQDSLGRSQLPGVIAFMGSLPRTPAGKVQRLSLFQSIQSVGGPAEAISDEPRSIILDVRVDSGGFRSCRNLEQKAGTVASLFAQKKASSAAGAQEIQDSMGQRRMVSQQGRFEMNVVFQMYTLGVLAVTLIHWRWYAKSMMGELTPPLQLLTAFLTQNKWHLQIFFAGAAYLDRDQPLSARDLAPFAFVFVLPVMYWLPIVPKSHVLATSWYGLGHPARWFFFCISASRLFSLSLRASGSSKLVQILLATPFACLWPYICMGLHSLASPGSRLDLACIWLGVGIPRMKIVNKLIGSTMTYLFFSNIMPTAIDLLALAGPKTRTGERRLGSLLWLLLTAWIVFDLRAGEHHQLEAYEMRVRLPSNSLMHHSWYLPFPIGLPFAWIRIGLLGAALVYLPFTAVPESTLHSLLGALLLMPFALHGRMVHTISKCLHHTGSSFGQLVVLVSFFCSFLVVLAPLCQTFVLHASRGCFKLFSKLAKV